MNGIDVVREAIAKLPLEIATGTVTKEGNTITVAEFLEKYLAPFMNNKTPEDAIIFVNTRLKQYITKAEIKEESNEYTTYKAQKPVIRRDEMIIEVNKPTITFAEPEKVDEVTPYVITTKAPTISFEQLQEKNEKNVRIKTFLLSDEKYSIIHKISPTEVQSFAGFMDAYGLEHVHIINNTVYLDWGTKQITLEEAYEKFMSPINVYEAELFDEKFHTIVGEIYDIMEARQIDDRNKEILFKSKTASGKTFFNYIKENITPLIPDTYDGPAGEYLKDYLEKIIGMQIAYDNERVNTNNNISPEGNTLDEVNKVGEIKILDGSITSEMLTLLTSEEKNSMNSNLLLEDDEKNYITRFEQLEVGIKLITDHDDLQVKYKEFTNLVAEAQLKCPNSNYIKTLISRINIIYENKNKSLKTINESKDTFKMMFETALAELKYNVNSASTFEEIVLSRIQIKALEEKMTSLGFTNNVYQAAIDNIKNILEARSLQIQAQRSNYFNYEENTNMIKAA